MTKKNQRPKLGLFVSHGASNNSNNQDAAARTWHHAKAYPVPVITKLSQSKMANHGSQQPSLATIFFEKFFSYDYPCYFTSAK
jgi:hypothetical protein